MSFKAGDLAARLIVAWMPLAGVDLIPSVIPLVLGWMLFDSPIYAIFLTLVVAFYWRLSWRKQNSVLLVCSYFF